MKTDSKVETQMHGPNSHRLVNAELSCIKAAEQGETWLDLTGRTEETQDFQRDMYKFFFLHVIEH